MPSRAHGGNLGRPGVVPDRVVSDGGHTAHRAASRPAAAEILRIESWDISASNCFGVRTLIYRVDLKALGASGDCVIVKPALGAGVVWTVVGIIVDLQQVIGAAPGVTPPSGSQR